MSWLVQDQLGSAEAGLHPEPGSFLDGTQMSALDPLGPSGVFCKWCGGVLTCPPAELCEIR